MLYAQYLLTQVTFNNKNFKKVITSFWNMFIYKSSFLQTYYTRSENVWNDGFLFDFLQKKTADAWIRRFVIYTGFLFSERLVFDYVVRIYLDNLIWPLHSISIFETSNVSEMLLNVLFMYLSLFTLLLSFYVLIL
jgi:hypothetical protein